MRKNNQKTRKSKNPFKSESDDFKEESEATISDVMYHQIQALRWLLRFSKSVKTHVSEQRKNYYDSIKRAFGGPPPRPLVLGSFGGIALIAVFWLGLTNHPENSPEAIELAAERNLKTAQNYVDLSTFYAQRSRFDKSLSISENGVRLFPDDVLMNLRAALANEHCGNDKRALQLIAIGREHLASTDLVNRTLFDSVEERILFHLKQLIDASK